MAVAVALLCEPDAAASTITIPYVFVNGTPANADEVNANFGVLVLESNSQDFRITLTESQLASTATSLAAVQVDVITIQSSVAQNASGVSSNSAAIQANSDAVSANTNELSERLPVIEMALLMLHFDGNDGATATSDATGRHSLISFSGEAQIDTALSKFGQSSVLISSGFGAGLTVAESPDFVMAGNLVDSKTIDFWVKYLDTPAGGDSLVYRQQTGVGSFVVHHDASVGLSVAVNSSTGTIVLAGPGGVITDTQWHHIAIVKVADVYAAYLDGQQVGYGVATETLAMTADELRIGGKPSSNTLQGHIDEFRISEGNPFQASPNGAMSDAIPVPGTAPGNYSGQLVVLQDDGSVVATDKNPADFMPVNTAVLTLAGGSSVPSLSSLVEADGRDGSRTAFDLTENREWTMNGTLSITEAEAKFGPGSINFDGTGSLSTPLDASFNTEFDNTVTIGFFFKLRSIPTGNDPLLWFRESATTFIEIYHNATDGLTVHYRAGGTDIFTYDAGGQGVVGDTNWHHFAFVKNFSIFNLYIDGARVLRFIETATSVDSGEVRIGSAAVSGSSFDGYVDNVIAGPNYFTNGQPSFAVPDSAVVRNDRHLLSSDPGSSEMIRSEPTVQDLINLVREPIKTGTTATEAGALPGEIWADVDDEYRLKLAP